MATADKIHHRKKTGGAANSVLTGGGWKLEDAKARFSEVVRLARSEGPQRVSIRGKDAVVVMSVEELERLAPASPRVPLVTFLEGLHLGGLDLTREHDQGRDVEL
jgi:antitoxin Phd